MVTGGGCLPSITIFFLISIGLYLHIFLEFDSIANDTSKPQASSTASSIDSDQSPALPPSLSSLLTQSIVFIYEDKTPPKNSNIIPGRVLGTAFIVGIPILGQPDKMLLFIVTAKHVVAEKRKILIRFTSLSGIKPLFKPYNLEELRRKNDLCEYPNDEGVDIIVFRTPYYRNTKILPFPAELIASKETFIKENINVLDRVSIPCLMENIPGASQNYPIFRDGTIALITEEQVSLKWELNKRIINTSQEVIFINSIVNEGFSGAPVFLWPGMRLTPKGHTIGGKPWLIGIVHGFYPNMRRLIDEERNEMTITKQVPGVLGKTLPSKQLRVYSQENPGTGIIFPSWRLLDILQQDGFKMRIKELTEEENKKQK
jgi:hypothetical protein